MGIVRINTSRDFYDRNEAAESSMTVRELIAILEQYDSSAKVVLRNDGGYTFGAIGEEDIRQVTY